MVNAVITSAALYVPNQELTLPSWCSGFICTLPTNWTRDENNDSGLNLTTLMQLLKQQNQAIARAKNAMTEGTQHT